MTSFWHMRSKAIAMKGRPWLRFSLRSFFGVIAAMCICLAWNVERATRQRSIVAEIEAAGGAVSYVEVITGSVREPKDARPFLLVYGHGRPSSRSWLHKLLGDDFLGHVVSVDFQNREVDNRLLDNISTLPSLRFLQFNTEKLSDAEMDLLHRELPGCYICDVYRPPRRTP